MATNSHALPHTPLRGLWLSLTRIAWLAVVALNYGIAIAYLPAYFHALASLALPDLEAIRVGLAELGLAGSFYATFALTFRVVGAGLFLASGALIFWRRADDWMALWFALPRPEWVCVGRLSDFPPGTQPHEPDNAEVFVVNTGEGLIVLSKRPPSPRADSCRKTWDPGLNRFRVPFISASYALNGTCIDGASPRDMDRHAHKIEGDDLWVDVNRSIPGAPVPVSSGGTPLPAETPAPLCCVQVKR